MATGDRISAWGAIAGQPPTTDFATFKRANIQQYSPFVYEFASGTAEELTFQDIFPAVYAGGGIDFSITWAGSDNTTGVATWALSLQRVTGVGLSDTFGTAQTGGVAGPGATDGIAVAVVSFTDGQLPAGLVAEDVWRCRVIKNAGGYAGTPRLLAIEALET